MTSTRHSILLAKLFLKLCCKRSILPNTRLSVASGFPLSTGFCLSVSSTDWFLSLHHGSQGFILGTFFSLYSLSLHGPTVTQVTATTYITVMIECMFANLTPLLSSSSTTSWTSPSGVPTCSHISSSIQQASPFSAAPEVTVLLLTDHFPPQPQLTWHVHSTLSFISILTAAPLI